MSCHHPPIYIYIKMTVTFPIVFSLWIHPGTHKNQGLHENIGEHFLNWKLVICDHSHFLRKSSSKSCPRNQCWAFTKTHALQPQRCWGDGWCAGRWSHAGQCFSPPPRKWQWARICGALQCVIIRGDAYAQRLGTLCFAICRLICVDCIVTQTHMLPMTPIIFNKSRNCLGMPKNPVFFPHNVLLQFLTNSWPMDTMPSKWKFNSQISVL